MEDLRCRVETRDYSLNRAHADFFRVTRTHSPSTSDTIGHVQLTQCRIVGRGGFPLPCRRVERAGHFPRCCFWQSSTVPVELLWFRSVSRDSMGPVYLESFEIRSSLSLSLSSFQFLKWACHFSKLWRHFECKVLRNALCVIFIYQRFRFKKI